MRNGGNNFINHDLGAGLTPESASPAEFPEPKADVPDFVFARALRLYSDGKFADPKGNLWVNQFLHFYREYMESRVKDMEFMTQMFPLIYPAYCLKIDQSDARADLIEAGIIANASYEAIGQFVALDPDIVSTYEVCCYNVRSRLSAPGYVMGTLIGPDFSYATASAPVTWKVVAYGGGWGLLKEYIHAGCAERDSKILKRLLNTNEMRKLLLASNIESITPGRAGFILDRYAKAGAELLPPEMKSASDLPVIDVLPDSLREFEKDLRQINVTPAMVDKTEMYTKDEERMTDEGLAHMKTFKEGKLVELTSGDEE